MRRHRADHLAGQEPAFRQTDEDVGALKAVGDRSADAGLVGPFEQSALGKMNRFGFLASTLKHFSKKSVEFVALCDKSFFNPLELLVGSVQSVFSCS